MAPAFAATLEGVTIGRACYHNFVNVQNLYLRPNARRSVEISAFPLSRTAAAGVAALQWELPRLPAGLAIQKEASWKNKCE
jgi:hypothetical protein